MMTVYIFKDKEKELKIVKNLTIKFSLRKQSQASINLPLWERGKR